MKKRIAFICTLTICTAVAFTACSNKQDTPFTQPAQGGAPAAPASSNSIYVSSSSDAQPDTTHPFGDSSSAQSDTSPDSDSSASSRSTSSASSSASAASNSGSNGGGSSSSSTTNTITQSGNRGATVRADGGLRLRASANTESDSLVTIPDGTHLTCTGWENGWAKTTYDGKTGYVSAAYLLLDGKVDADGGLRLRSGPGESYEKLLTIPNGTVLAFTEQKDGWAKTTYDGKTGYVSQEYVLISAKVTAGPGLNLRETASENGNKLTTIPNGSTVQCIGARDGDWIKVKYSGYEGYVSAQYLSFE